MLSRRLIALLAVLTVVCTPLHLRAAHGQAFAHLLPPIYEFKDVQADLAASAAEVPAAPLLQAYRQYLESWHTLMSTARPDLERQVGLRFDVPPTEAEAERALQVVRQAESRAESAEETLFSAFAEALPEAERPRVERARRWRQTIRSTPASVPGIAMLRIEDIALRVRRLDISPELRNELLTVLDASESSRRTDLLHLKRDADEGPIREARARAANEAAGGNDPSSRTQSFLARSPRADLYGNVMASQWAAFQSIESRLPAQQRRSLTDEFFRQNVSDQMRGEELKLPSVALFLQCPSDVAWALLAWSDLDPAKREATRAVAAAWIAQDDAIVRGYIEATVKGLRANQVELRSLGLPTKVQRRRGQVTAEFLPKLIAASGAAWLGEPSHMPPPIEVNKLTPEDREVVGGYRPARPATGKSIERVLRRRAFLPDPLDTEWVTRIAEVAQLDEGQRALLDQLAQDYAIAWGERVEPHVEVVLRSEAEINRLRSDRESGKPGELEAALARSIAERPRAYEEMFALDAGLFESLRAASQESAHAHIDVAQADRVITPALSHILTASNSAEILNPERAGGRLINFAQIFRRTKLAPPLRAMLEQELSGEWANLRDLGKTLLTGRLKALGAEQANDLAGQTGETIDPADDANQADAELLSSDQDRREGALLALADRWRQAEDRIVQRLLERADAAGDPDHSMRDLIEQQRFPTVTRHAARADELLEALDAVGPTVPIDPEAKAAAIASLRESRAVMARLARHWIDTCGQRSTLANRTEEERNGLDNTRGWRSMDVSRTCGELSSATLWYINGRLPPEVRSLPALQPLLGRG